MTPRRKFLVSSLGATLASALPATSQTVSAANSDIPNQQPDKTVSFGTQDTRRRASVQAQSGVEEFSSQLATTEGHGKRPALSFLPPDATPLSERFGLKGGKQ